VVFLIFILTSVFNITLGDSTSFLSSSPPPPPPLKKTLRQQLKQKSILKRLSLMKRSSKDSNAVDLDRVKQLFPHWLLSESGGLGEERSFLATPAAAPEAPEAPAAPAAPATPTPSAATPTTPTTPAAPDVFQRRFDVDTVLSELIFAVSLLVASELEDF
jgi:hypothetical protein